jgi:hypothetical protein
MFHNNYRNPELWGSHAWMFLHCVSYTYPDSPTLRDQQHYLKFFDSLRFVLPCKICQQHYSEYLQKHPIKSALKSKKKLSDYIFKLHDHINTHFKNKENLTLEQSRNLFENKCIQKFL